MNTTNRYKLPTIKDLSSLVRAVKANISDEYRVSDDPDDETPGIQLTVGANEKGEWSYQTGDNSYSGGAYHYPYWGVAGVYRNSNSREVAKDIQDQLADLMAQ